MKQKDKDVSANEVLPTPPALRTLAPKFDLKLHGLYLAALEQAISEPENLNIALSGSYGVGKSSVLQKFSELHTAEVVDVSFSGLTSDFKVTPTEGGDVNPASTTKTNQIQKEIVKQLLYKEPPASTPASKYRRPETFQWKREVAVSGLVGLSLSAVAYFAGFLDRPIETFLDGRLASALFLVFIAAATSGTVFGLRRLFHNRVIIEKLSAGPATIALSPQTTSFFDEYLDEIVYFFQASSRRFVVFEDLDRFNDHEIFQSLRALNTILNRSAQLTKKPIVFVYALRDSIFESKAHGVQDAAEAEIELANRTKFFDLVIPMVPFVSSRNARDLMVTEIENRGFSISPELVDLAAQHVADMRLILNILNEFSVFNSTLVQGQTRAPNLTDDKLFALILYKSVHLRDFEMIRLSRSQLDRLYERYREFVSLAVQHKVDRANGLQASRVISERRSERAHRYASGLDQYIRVTASSLGIPASYPNSIVLGARTLSATDIELPATWREISNEESGLEVTLGAGYVNQVLSISHASLSEIVGSDLPLSEWSEPISPDLLSDHAAALAEAREAAHLDMEDLFGRPELVISISPDIVENFAGATERLLQSRLARELVRNGYIDQYFALYAAQYHSSRVSENAMNFIIRHVDKGMSDPIYELSDEDIESVLRERPEVVRDKSVLNADLVDYLLRKELDTSEVVRQVSGQDPDASLFLQYVLGGARSSAPLVENLAKEWNGALVYLSSTLETDDENRLRLVSLATSSLSTKLDYLIDDQLANFVKENAANLPFLTEEHEETEPSVRLLRKLNVKIADVDTLGASIREAAVANEAFEFTEHNLRSITGRQDFSLDSLLEYSDGLYNYALRVLGRYLNLLRESAQVAIRSEATLARTLNAISETPYVEDLTAQTLSTVRVSDLSTVPISTWSHVARRGLLRPSARNVFAFFSELGWEDAIVAAVRKRRSLDDIEDLTAASREELAKALLTAKELSATLRAQIAKRLLDGTTLDPVDVPLDSPELFGMLLKKAALPDDSSTFLATKGAAWKWREAVIAASKTFNDYVTPTMLTANEVGSIASSSVVGTPNKRFIYSDLSSYGKGSKAVLTDIAQHAQRQKLFIPISDIALLAERGLNPDWAIALTWIGLSRRTLAGIESVLTALGGKYSQLTAPSNKRPSFPKDYWHETLLNYLVANGQPKKYDIAWWDHDLLVVNMKN